MRPFLARFSEPVWSGHLASWADFITTTPELEFSVHTAAPRVPVGLLQTSSMTALRLAAEVLHDSTRVTIASPLVVFSPTHIVQDVATLIGEGLDDDPPFVNMVLNVHRGFQGTMPYTAKTLQFMIDLLPKNAIFGISGIGPAQLPASIQSVLLGGHARTRLEDNLYFAHGDLATNQRLMRIVRDMGFEPATPAEARKMLGLPRYNVPRPEFAVAEAARR